MSTKPAVGLCPDISIAAGDPLVRERVGPDPEVSHRAQEGQGCADHDVSGRRRAAEAPRVAQRPRTSLTIALTDTAASGPELQRRPCATSRRRGRCPPLRIRRSRTGIGRHAREQRPDGRCNLVASRPRRAAGSAHSGDGGLRVGESGDSRTRNSPRARVGANSLADGARAAPFCVRSTLGYGYRIGDNTAWDVVMADSGAGRVSAMLKAATNRRERPINAATCYNVASYRRSAVSRATLSAYCARLYLLARRVAPAVAR